ncbi:MAG: alpha/beta fold hydrolase, partial [Chloroflexota bacterium]
MASTRLFFENQNGEKIGARLDSPEDEVKAYALFAHCFTCHKNLNAVRHISSSLNKAGIAVLRFDFTGLGESEGDFADTNFSSNVEDLIYAADFLASEYESPKFLIGHSLGGAAVLMATSKLPHVQAVVTLGAPCDPEHVTHLLECSVEEIEANGYANVSLAGRPFTIKKQFLDDLAAQKMD